MVFELVIGYWSELFEEQYGSIEKVRKEGIIRYDG